MKSQLFNYACQCNMCGDCVDASQIHVTVDYGDFYNVVTDEIDHIVGLYVECEDCIENN